MGPGSQPAPDAASIPYTLDIVAKLPLDAIRDMHDVNERIASALASKSTTPVPVQPIRFAGVVSPKHSVCEIGPPWFERSHS